MKIVSVGVMILFLIAGLLPCEGAMAAVSTVAQKPEALSLDIKGMDILDVFRLLSMRGNINIIAGKNVTGKVTLFLKDVDIWDAFEIIVAANALAYEKRGNIIYVMTERDYELQYGKKYEDKRIVKSIKLKHVSAADVSKAVSQLKTNIGRVISDETSETIVFMDIPQAVSDMEKVIEGLDIPLITKVYTLQYAKAEDVKEKLSEMLTNNIGSLCIDERTNKVAVTDLEENIEMFDKVIKAFDEKHKEVIIEAKILQITLNDDYKMGVNWDAIFLNMKNTLHQIAKVGVNLQYSGATAIIPTTTSGGGSGGALQVGELSTEGYQAVIQALREYGKTNLLSSPRIATLNNEEAKILVGTNRPYATRRISQGTGGSSNIEEETVTFIDLGVKLNVTPTINEHGFITMKIKPEVSSQTGEFEIISSGNLIPIVKTTTTETTVMVKDGATILIGGLIEENIRENTKEVPGLSKIPLIGGLFRSKTRGSGDSTNPEKTELVIFLTPHIISGEEEKSSLTVEKLTQEDEIKKIESEGSLTKLIDTKNMGSSEYYQLISDIITSEVEKRRPSIPIYGEILLSFSIDNAGNLITKPQIFRGRNKELADIGKNSIIKAAPFPPFPDSIKKEKEVFKIAISYE